MGIGLSEDLKRGREGAAEASQTQGTGGAKALRQNILEEQD